MSQTGRQPDAEDSGLGAGDGDVSGDAVPGDAVPGDAPSSSIPRSVSPPSDGRSWTSNSGCGYVDLPTRDADSRSDEEARVDADADIFSNSDHPETADGFSAASSILRPVPQAEPRPEKTFPRRIGSYDILALVARGGMGVVYKARHVTLGRVVALKMIRAAELASRRELSRFRTEAQAAAHLEHPAIVPIYEVGEHEGNPFFSMVYVDGGTLAGRLADGPMEPLAAAHLVHAVADAVAYAHDRGVIHRDLKPSNVLLTLDGTPKVSDFGLAKRAGSSDGHTLEGQVIGTPSYMPPEQARGEIEAIGPLSDIYSVGALLYHAICGRPPFHAATTVATLRQVLDTDPVPPRQLNAAVDADLETIALKCLEKDPSRRYSSAAALATDLRAYLDGEPIRARPTPLAERAWKWARRRPALALLGGATVAALLSLAAAGFYQAEAANQRARLAELEVRDRAERDEARRGVYAAFERCRDLLDADRPQEARVAIAEALARIESVAGLEPERQRCETLLAEVDTRLAAAAASDATRRRLDAFRRHRDAALFHGLQSFGLDPRKNQEVAVAEAGAALRLFGLDADESRGTSATEDRATKYRATDKRATDNTAAETSAAAVVPASAAEGPDLRGPDLRGQCHELLLVRADACVRAAGGDAASVGDAAARALADVARAAALLGSETQAGRLQRADYLELAGDIAAAREERRLAAEEGPINVASDHFLIAKQLAGRPNASAADLARAAESFERALLLDPAHFWAQYGLGSLELRRGRPELAEVHLTSCIGRRPDFAWAWILRGAARSAQGEHDLAEEDFAKAVELAPEREAVHVALQQRGVLEFARGDADAARRLLREAADLEPAAFQPLVSLATVESKSGRFDEALRLLDAAGRIAPIEPLMPRERARLHADRRDFAAAERDCRLAVRLESADAAARADDLCLLGEMIFRQGRAAEALRTWEMAIAVDPDHPRAHLWRAVALVDTQRFAEALPSFEACLRKGQPSLELYLTRGMCRASLGDYAAAIDDYSRAIEIAPSASAHAQRGWLYALRGNPLFGLQDFDKALALDPAHADAHCGRGLTLAYLGRHTDATAAAEKALDLGAPSFRHAYKAATVFAAAAPRVVFSARERAAQGPSVGQLRVRYLARACELVEHALTHEAADDHDDLWLAHVEGDPHFQPLLAEPEFRKLKARVMAGETTGRGDQEANETVRRPDETAATATDGGGGSTIGRAATVSAESTRNAGGRP